MKITVLGAGGMGSRFAIMLHNAGNEVNLVDGWQENIDAIRNNGISANMNNQDINVRLPISTPQEIDKTGNNADLIIVFTKSNQLQETFEAVKPIIGRTTYVLCLLNGIGHEEILKEFVPTKNILQGITMWTAIMDGPGKVRLSGDGNVELQNFEPEGKVFAEKVVDVFNKAGLNAKYSNNVKYSIWRKACVNGTLNSLCTILECNIGQLGKTKEADTLLKKIIAEFAAVSEKEGIRLDQNEVFNHVSETFSGVGEHYPSMYQDLIKNHRLTEINFINGAVTNKGEKYGISTPYCDILTQLIHAKEEILNVS
ncbi:2-dehydropantoate 2-reductase [Xylocopilactobacillus apis]|uniref:2-dehydropantoate 2-reductase n=1 Tax=Xylocopilactobacillus apis TaxID=2932183 RepID=A0AAU9DI16_9LACO|nr:2-dehydropantoate 2-reductase [Xylocopilactobacillus apis]BDR56382.1 2-dehydropantoate 2-reductase [Xylocopilactobacillus apis]